MATVFPIVKDQFRLLATRWQQPVAKENFNYCIFSDPPLDGRIALLMYKVVVSPVNSIYCTRYLFGMNKIT